MNRRHALKIMTGAAFASCPTCLALTSATSALAAETAHGEAPRWSYEGADGPSHWSELSPANRVCGVGFQQSPIDIDSSIRAEVGGIGISYGAMPLRVVNNGHTIQVNCEPGSEIRMDGQTFKLLQFHFHHPSEHTFRGKSFDMEAHFVHASADGTLAVLGVFIAKGAPNDVLAPIWHNMPTVAGPEKRVNSVSVFPERLLPADRTFHRYYGSLTTPPCSEKVIWSVYGTPVEASSAQVGKFASIFPGNARPIQNLNRRFLLKSQ